MITYFEIPNKNRWLEIIGKGSIIMPRSCKWRTDDEIYCSYIYKDLQDYLIHNYYHAHIVRISGIILSYTNIPWFLKGRKFPKKVS